MKKHASKNLLQINKKDVITVHMLLRIRWMKNRIIRWLILRLIGDVVDIEIRKTSIQNHVVFQLVDKRRIPYGLWRVDEKPISIGSFQVVKIIRLRS